MAPETPPFPTPMHQDTYNRSISVKETTRLICTSEAEGRPPEYCRDGWDSVLKVVYPKNATFVEKR